MRPLSIRPGRQVAARACLALLLLLVGTGDARAQAADGEEKGVKDASQADQKSDRAVSAHKANYFSIDRWPGTAGAQVKFQISMKFRLLEPRLYVFKRQLFPIYIGYTQKSLWNAGERSMPFEESNYNPELFLEYPVNVSLYGRLKLTSVAICPLEHESNGLPGELSRSWSRQYVLARLTYKSLEVLEIPNSFIPEKASLYVKGWHYIEKSDQDGHLRTVGSNGRFTDYTGYGEAGLSVRNFLWRGSLKNHQLDIKTPIFRDGARESWEIQFRQQLPKMNFSLYLQYWYGYGETLLRFDRFGRRAFAGLSFTY